MSSLLLSDAFEPRGVVLIAKLPELGLDTSSLRSCPLVNSLLRIAFLRLVVLPRALLAGAVAPPSRFADALVRVGSSGISWRICAVDCSQPWPCVSIECQSAFGVGAQQ